MKIQRKENKKTSMKKPMHARGNPSKRHQLTTNFGFCTPTKTNKFSHQNIVQGLGTHLTLAENVEQRLP